MQKLLWLLLAAIGFAVGAADPASAQLNVPQISIAGWQAASLPCSTNVYIPVVPSGSPFVSQYISCNALATTFGQQNFYNKTLISPTIQGGALTAPAGSPVTFVGINNLGNIVTGTPAGGGNVTASSPSSGSLAVWGTGTSLGAALAPTTNGYVPLVSGGAWATGQQQFANLGGSPSTVQLQTNLAPALASIFSTTGTLAVCYGQTAAGLNILVSCPSGGGGSANITGQVAGQVPVAGGASLLNSSIPYGTTGTSTLVATDLNGHIATSLLAANAALTNIGAGGISPSYLAAGAALSNIGLSNVTATYLAPGAVLQSIGSVSNAQFIGYGAGTGSGTPQPVTIMAGSGASFNCAAGTPQVCTIGATGAGGVSGPTNTVVGFAPLWNSDTGNALSTGVPVGQTGNSTIIESSPSGTLASSLISALPNSSLANSQVTIGSTTVQLGGTIPTVAGVTLTSPMINSGTLAGVTGGNPSFSGTVTLQNVMFSLGSDALGNLYYRNSSGLLTRLAIGSGVLTDVSGIPAWAPAPITGINTLSGDVTASGTGSQPAKVVGLQGFSVATTTPTAGQLFGYSGVSWGPVNAPISGINALTQDVSASGTGPQAATVTGIQGRPVNSTAPTLGQMIGWNGSAYAPESIPPATGVTAGSYTVATASAAYYCETLNVAGQVTSMISGACTTGGNLATDAGVLLQTDASVQLLAN